MHWETMWKFHTKRFSVSWQIAPDFDLDLSWDDDGSIRQGLDSGFYTAFMSRVVVLLDGNEIGVDYLGGSIYENPAEFRDHIGIKKQPHCGSYFSQMVRQAIAEARNRLCNAPKIRCS